MTLRLQVDRGICLSAGYCLSEAADVFAWDADDLVAVKDGNSLSAGPVDVPADSEGAVRRAEMICPSGAIVVSEEQY